MNAILKAAVQSHFHHQSIYLVPGPNWNTGALYNIVKTYKLRISTDSKICSIYVQLVLFDLKPKIMNTKQLMSCTLINSCYDKWWKQLYLLKVFYFICCYWIFVWIYIWIFFHQVLLLLIILWSKSWCVAFLLAACNCSVAGTKNATLPGVLYLDCLRDENTVPLRPGMVSALSVSIHNCLTMTWVGDVAVYHENSVLNSD